jgi:hypothetical protein
MADVGFWFDTAAAVRGAGELSGCAFDGARPEVAFASGGGVLAGSAGAFGTDGAGGKADATGGASVTEMRTSSAFARLSFQGKRRPGRPNAWPPRVTLNSNT